MSLIAKTPSPAYYAVIFTSRLRDGVEGYAAMSARMKELAARQPGYLGLESARGEVGITVSYWKDLQSIKAWKAHLEHLQAQAAGREKWYSTFKVRIARVERDYDFSCDELE
jgi:heme-degrading monooxygenase HmoA